MDKLSYIGAATGKTINLDCKDMLVGQGLGIRSREWAYDIGLNNLTNINRQTREVDIEFATRSLETLDEMTRVFEADIAAGTPGLFYSNGWQQRGYLVSFSPSSVFANFVTATGKAVLLDGAWRKPETLGMYPNSGDTDGTKKYAYEYGYEYASTYGVRYITVDSAAPIHISMTIWGYSVSPNVKIADNNYHFDLIVPANSYLSVDTRPDPKVILTDAAGKKTDQFKCAQRGNGEGSGNYAFQRVPPGTHQVIWDDTFGFDLTLWHERSDLPYANSNS